jgi:hypothetical protein
MGRTARHPVFHHPRPWRWAFLVQALLFALPLAIGITSFLPAGNVRDLLISLALTVILEGVLLWRSWSVARVVVLSSEGIEARTFAGHAVSIRWADVAQVTSSGDPTVATQPERLTIRSRDRSQRITITAFIDRFDELSRAVHSRVGSGSNGLPVPGDQRIAAASGRRRRLSGVQVWMVLAVFAAAVLALAVYVVPRQLRATNPNLRSSGAIVVSV